VAFQGRVMMYEAVSTDKKMIKTGEQVVVIDIVGGNTLVVEKS
jgi:membrane protein implicated in regulation of membrane protease activity